MIRLIRQSGNQHSTRQCIGRVRPDNATRFSDEVVDGFMQAAKEQARRIYEQQGVPQARIRTLTSMINPTAGEFYVVKLLRSVLNNYSKRETSYEMKGNLCYRGLG